MTESITLLRRAVHLLVEEHAAHHADCCVHEDDLCHIGQFMKQAERFI